LSPLLLSVEVGKEMMVRNLLLAGANVQVSKTDILTKTLILFNS
jgi:hypothetical protein